MAGLEVTFGALGLAFLATALLAHALPPDAPPPPLGAQPRAVTELMQGFRLVSLHPELRLLVGVFTAGAFVQSMMDVLIVVAALDLLDIGQSGASLLNACWGAGGIAGAAVATALLGRGRLAWGLFAGCVLAGLPFALIGVTVTASTAVVLMLVLGIGFALCEIATLTLTQRLAAGDVLGRVYGVEETLYVGAMALGGLAGALLVAPLGARWAIVLTGLALPVLALVLRAPLSAFEAGEEVREESFGLLRSLPLFATLPVATVETLAVRSQVGRFSAGTDIITQDDEAEALLRDRGGHGRGVRRRRPAPHGERGRVLRRDRAAARRPADRDGAGRERRCRSSRSTRDDFLEGIGSHARSTHAAEAVVVERLAPAEA